MHGWAPHKKRRIADFEASEKALGEFVNKHVVVAEDDPIEGVAA